MLPQFCANGHEWHNFNRNKEGANYFLHCTARSTVEPTQRDEENSGDEASSGKRQKMCNRKLTWRRPGTLPYFCARTMSPDVYLKCLYWFSDDCPYKTGRRHAGASSKIWSKFVFRVRSILWLVVSKLQDGQGQMGGPGKIVAVDETWLTTKNAHVAVSVVERQQVPRPQCLA